VILMAAFWPVPIARWVSAVANSLMLAATPIDGSHYLVDVLAGVAVAVVCLLAARKFVSRTIAMPVTARSFAPAGVRVASSR
jgi:membrane-associated phospholipid phosphatase